MLIALTHTRHHILLVNLLSEGDSHPFIQYSSCWFNCTSFKLIYKMPTEPENTSAIICYYNESVFILEQRWQGRYDNKKEYLSINRKSCEMVCNIIVRKYSIKSTRTTTKINNSARFSESSTSMVKNSCCSATRRR